MLFLRCGGSELGGESALLFGLVCWRGVGLESGRGCRWGDEVMVDGRRGCGIDGWGWFGGGGDVVYR